MDVFHGFHAGTTDMVCFNQAHIVLLLKKLGATSIVDFRSTSLQNYTPKLAAKILPNQLQSSIPMLISSCQIGFVKGRSRDRSLIISCSL
jgi:hypothetical protein